jgi:hypothetical protein
MHPINRSRGGIDLLLSDEEVSLASKHNPFDAENGGGRKYCSKYSLFTIYGLAVTVTSKEWWPPPPAHISYISRTGGDCRS